MGVTKLFKDPMRDKKTVPAHVFAMADYPEALEDYAVWTAEMYSSYIPEFLKMYPDSVNVTLFLTKNKESVMRNTGVTILNEAKGAIVAMQDIAEDAIYFLSSVFQADMFIRLMDNPPVDDKQLLAIWHPEVGICALAKGKDDEEYQAVDNDPVLHLLPLSLLREPGELN